MKKIVALLIVAALLCGVCAGCGLDENATAAAGNATSGSSEKITYKDITYQLPLGTVAFGDNASNYSYGVCYSYTVDKGGLYHFFVFDGSSSLYGPLFFDEYITYYSSDSSSTYSFNNGAYITVGRNQDNAPVKVYSYTLPKYENYIKEIITNEDFLVSVYQSKELEAWKKSAEKAIDQYLEYKEKESSISEDLIKEAFPDDEP